MLILLAFLILAPEKVLCTHAGHTGHKERHGQTIGHNVHSPGHRQTEAETSRGLAEGSAKEDKCSASTKGLCDGPLPEFPHGHIMESADYVGERMLVFSCEEGYILMGSPVLTCDCLHWNNPYPKCAIRDCLTHLKSGHNKSGVYGIGPDGDNMVMAYCDMRIQGGWTVIQRRVDASTDFQRNWRNYKKGFGDVQGNFWIGLETLKLLTNFESELYIFIKGNYFEPTYARYDTFRIGNEGDNYRLHVSGYHGNAGDFLGPHNNQQFTTIDKNNQHDDENCATTERSGGWWYGSKYPRMSRCGPSNLNGIYGEVSELRILWSEVNYAFRQIPFVQMMIRRKSDPSDDLPEVDPS